ncbi:hypothetical protein C7M84_007984 [Penaeus vannamei]|uniref:Uncharacterized protein n=1 Tax=Penaeus vannamei TaxID=6689 RepID=A0A423TAS3_PENVA|nr:hypothetical protein C7M84_007984 [Penaeus vannamei]
MLGADFKLTEDLRPWLIEINSSPCMASTTSVTKRMCAQCLQDLSLQTVVVDYKHNKTADTGQFELAYRDSERSVPNPPYLGVNLQVVGRQIKKGPVKIEKRKPKKARPAERLVKPLPLITLSLEEGAHYGPREHALPHHHPHPRETPGAFARRCYLLDCRRYAAGGAGGSATPGGPGSAPVLAPIGSEEESGERGTSADSSGEGRGQRRRGRVGRGIQLLLELHFQVRERSHERLATQLLRLVTCPEVGRRRSGCARGRRGPKEFVGARRRLSEFVGDRRKLSEFVGARWRLGDRRNSSSEITDDRRKPLKSTEGRQGSSHPVD